MIRVHIKLRDGKIGIFEVDTDDCAEARSAVIREVPDGRIVLAVINGRRVIPVSINPLEAA